MNGNDISWQTMASMFDHTLLKPHASTNDLTLHCNEAVQYGFKTVAVNCASVQYCQLQLQRSGVLVDAAVSFPFGQSTIETKVFETIDAIGNGADDVDYVVNIAEIKNGNWQYIENEMLRIVEECEKRKIVSKVIFENCYLTTNEKIKLCELARKIGPSFVKTSTGFGSGGATTDDVKLMKAHIGDKVKIKAAGGIRTASDALAMIEAGASRIGVSVGCTIIDEYRRLLNKEE